MILMQLGRQIREWTQLILCWDTRDAVLQCNTAILSHPIAGHGMSHVIQMMASVTQDARDYRDQEHEWWMGIGGRGGPLVVMLASGDKSFDNIGASRIGENANRGMHVLQHGQLDRTVLSNTVAYEFCFRGTYINGEILREPGRRER